MVFILLCFFLLLHSVLEFLPISSSGHLKLFLAYLHLPEIPEPLIFFFHITNLCALIIFFIHDYKILNIKLQEFIHLFLCVLISDMITTIFYFLFKLEQFQIIKAKFLLSYGFFITAILLVATYFIKQKNEHLSFGKAFFIGLAQGIAFLPGISRLAATYFTALFLNISGKQSFIYSYLITLPLFFAASLKGLLLSKDLFLQFSLMQVSMFILITLFSIYVAYKIFIYIYWLAKNNELYYFGFYLIIPMILAILKNL